MDIKLTEEHQMLRQMVRDTSEIQKVVIASHLLR